ncbi:PAAR domain-containing protein [Chitinispirillales bacterium ANBcel5]|uniref:PAAR domain-containing protein n=1 Tax=Cellulosispirillum alkaliphilum TaxID=3039283 RepID=UPI002A51AF52|nr:PAAR domain-containing protein [Chitinispirillales bacterium ANBcel5]
MMAARITDMTAHGGTITGPGAPNVLIGKMVAARMGDMHMCPMVTPGMPPIPHVGGPIVGGCPTVLIGSGGGGGGGGGGTSASQASAAKALKEGKIKPVEGTETLLLCSSYNASLFPLHPITSKLNKQNSKTFFIGVPFYV